ncbi:N-acetyltransferase [Filobacillus milosensis]|uniref:N-acetyltransferase n=1 Tax=Filobacillus milosensis TaxID=94137 RepID=A0A4Y8IST8_9BACI|nr:N-acetyltransferase [Filobacillus milosensis]
MEVQTERLRIVPCTRDFLSSRSDHYKIRPHIKSYLDNLDYDPDLVGWGVWIVITKTNDNMIGDIGFKGKPVDFQVEIGGGILPHSQGFGYATESIKGLINWAFSSEQVTTIKAECHASNKPSIRIMEKIDMVKVKEKNRFINWELTRL